MYITKDNYPTIHHAFEIISHDGGRQAGHERYEIPDSYNDLDKIEEALKELPPINLETLCIGEFDEAQSIANRSTNLKLADTLLEQFADEFADYPF